MECGWGTWDRDRVRPSILGVPVRIAEHFLGWKLVSFCAFLECCDLPVY